jgi:hypothetical protein
VSRKSSAEQQAIEQFDAAQPVEQQALDSKISQAEQAKPEQASTKIQSSDTSELQAQAPEKSYDSAIEADSKVARAVLASDDVRISDATGKTTVPGQMTDTRHYNQGEHPDCLLQSARMAEARQTGKDPGLETYKNEAINKNNYSEQEGGVGDMEKFAAQINDRPDLKANYQEQGSLEKIKNELDQGKSVIVGVDAGEFFQNEFIPDNAGHAVVVTGAEKATDGSWKITVNDSNATGPNSEVSEFVFKNAWNNMNNPMIVVSKSGAV